MVVIVVRSFALRTSRIYIVQDICVSDLICFSRPASEPPNPASPSNAQARTSLFSPTLLRLSPFPDHAHRRYGVARRAGGRAGSARRGDWLVLRSCGERNKISAVRAWEPAGRLPRETRSRRFDRICNTATRGHASPTTPGKLQGSVVLAFAPGHDGAGIHAHSRGFGSTKVREPGQGSTGAHCDWITHALSSLQKGRRRLRKFNFICKTRRCSNTQSNKETAKNSDNPTSLTNLRNHPRTARPTRTHI